jgi:VWFA-related protein
VIRPRSFRSVSILLAALACIWAAPSGLPVGAVSAERRQATQGPPAADPQQPTPVFRGGVDSVSVDVRVTDRTGRPITDLTAADFEIRENGRVQTITTFKLIQTDDGREDPAARRDVRTIVDQEIEAAREENRLFAIFLDDYHTRDINAVRIRQQLADFVSGLTPHDLVALATPTSSLRALTFSRNHDQTAANILNFEGRKYNYLPRTPFEERYANQLPAVQERMRNDLTLAALEGLCVVLGGLRDGRKTVLFVSEGLSGTLPPGVRTRGTPPMPGSESQTAVDPDAAERRVFLNQAEVLSDMQQVFRAAARANTAIYTIDPRGLLATEFSVEDNVDQASDRLVMTASLDSLRTIANETDGRAIVTQGDPLPHLQRMVRDSSTYYLVGYTSSLAPRDGKFHEIDVRLRRRELQVSARKGYWAYSEEDVKRITAPARPAASPEVTAALEELATLTARSASDAGLTVWAGARRGSSEKPLVTIVWEAPPGLGRSPGSVVKTVDVEVTSEGGETLFKGPIASDPAASRPAGQVTFEAPVGMLRVRVTAQSGSGERLDVRDRHLDVPDLTATGPRLTTPFVFRGRTVLDLKQVRTQATPLPAAARTFARSERILLRFQALGPAGAAPVVELKLLNPTGQALATFPPPPSVDGITHEAEMTFGAFPPGDYVIEISAQSSGTVVREHLAIRVTG